MSKKKKANKAKENKNLAPVEETVDTPETEVAETLIPENVAKPETDNSIKEERAMFPTELFGFSKEKVAEYIIKQDAQVHKRLSVLQEKAEKLTKLLEEKESEIASLKSALENKESLYENNPIEVPDLLSEDEQDSLIESIKDKSSEILEKTMAKAESMIKEAEIKAKEEREKYADELNHNLRKLKYLYKKRDELQAFFNEQKEKADSFYSKVIDKE